MFALPEDNVPSIIPYNYHITYINYNTTCYTDIIIHHYTSLYIIIHHYTSLYIIIHPSYFSWMNYHNPHHLSGRTRRRRANISPWPSVSASSLAPTARAPSAVAPSTQRWRWDWTWPVPRCWGDLPGLVNCHIAMERSTIFNGKIYYKSHLPGLVN